MYLLCRQAVRLSYWEESATFFYSYENLSNISQLWSTTTKGNDTFEMPLKWGTMKPVIHVLVTSIKPEADFWGSSMIFLFIFFPLLANLIGYPQVWGKWDVSKDFSFKLKRQNKMKATHTKK